MKIGVIDLGSNSIRLVIYEYVDKELKKILNLKHQGKSVLFIKDNKMSDEGVEAIVSSLKQLIFVAKVYELDEFRIFATASLRNISNSAETVAKIEKQIHHKMEVLSDEEESLFGFEAILRNEELPLSGLTIDIGGGSMEIIYYKDKEALFSTSIPVGSLSFATRFVDEVIPTEDEQAEMRKFIRNHYESLPWLKAIQVNSIMGIGGTSRGMFRMNKELELEKNGALKYETVATIANLSFEHSKQIINAVPDRLMTMLPGAIMIDELMQLVLADEFKASKMSVREGYIYNRILNKYEQ
jgi:exopolyphosphatase/guanosine-5'-triphosphate,3'-diphosphate pyrophosphatase